MRGGEEGGIFGTCTYLVVTEKCHAGAPCTAVCPCLCPCLFIAVLSRGEIISRV